MEDKEIKKRFRKIAESKYKEFYPVKTLEELGYKRMKCKVCGRYFWSTVERETCGDPICNNGYQFIDKKTTTKELGYTDVWKEFSSMFNNLGYKPIKRYPVVARWNPTTDFTIASIAAFQPWVVSGNVEPPSKRLVIPQFCLRFNDIDNVGVTGHFTGFVMIGQHAFVQKKDYNINKYFSDIFKWLTKGMGINKDEIQFHEDSWAGGGNLGPSMEFFSHGLELGNQVYMQYEQTKNGYKELNIKVLDMGAGQERMSWFTQTNKNIYESVFPSVVKKLYVVGDVKKQDIDLLNRFLPYSALLNIDEVKDIDKAWKDISTFLGMDVEKLKQKIKYLASLFSIAEHSRTLLFGLNDSALPSNSGGGYNLRLLFRRAQSLIDKYNLDVTIGELIESHAKELKKQYPELEENLDEVRKIIEVERKKYINTLGNSKRLLSRIISEKKIDDEKLILLYDSYGISPDIIRQEAKKIGKTIMIPEDFYIRISKMHEEKRKKELLKTEKQVDIDLSDLKNKTGETEILYYDDYKLTNFEARVVKIIKKDKYYVVLDKTAFYPTSGGQMNDKGKMNDCDVVDVFKHGSYIVHVLDRINFKENDIVKCSIDFERRLQLTQHHTATHIINGSARMLLGNHVWQSSAAKYIDKARLDITHYDKLTRKELDEIERIANTVIQNDIPIISNIYERNIAEAKYGFRIYQGGAVPGKTLRIVEIPDFDVEACGGTHCKTTGEVGEIKIIKSTKIQDGIVRIEFVAGNAEKKLIQQELDIINELCKMLDTKKEFIVYRVEELFNKWKKARKEMKKGKKINTKELNLVSKKEFKGTITEMINKISEILNTQKEYAVKTVKRFLNQLNEFKNK